MEPAFNILSNRVLFAEELDRGFGRLPRGHLIVLEGACHPGETPRAQPGASQEPSIQLSCPICHKAIIALALAEPFDAAQSLETTCACSASPVFGYPVGSATLAILCPQCQGELRRLPLRKTPAPPATQPAVQQADILDVFDHFKRRQRRH